MKTIIVLAAAIVAVMLLALGRSPASATHLPLEEVAIDVDVTGNTAASLGPTEYCNAEPLEVGETVDIDVVVRGVPEWVPPTSGDIHDQGNEGIWGYGTHLYFDPSVLYVEKVHAFDGPSLIWEEEPIAKFVVVDYFDGRRDEGLGEPSESQQTSGSGPSNRVRIDAVDLGAAFESGDGILTRITMKAVGNGVSSVLFGDSITGGGFGKPGILDASLNFAYPIDNVGYGTLVVGDNQCPSVLPTPTVAPATPTRPPPSTARYELSFRQRPGSNLVDVVADAESPGLLRWSILFDEEASTHLECRETSLPQTGCSDGGGMLGLVGSLDSPIVGEGILGTIEFVPRNAETTQVVLDPFEVIFVDPLERDVRNNIVWEPTAIILQTPTPTPTFPPSTPTRTPPSATCACIPIPTATVTPSPTASTTAAATPAVTPAALPRAGDAMDSPKNGGVVLIVVSAALIVAGSWVVARGRALMR